jgi:hypothetical protein
MPERIRPARLHDGVVRTMVSRWLPAIAAGILLTACGALLAPDLGAEPGDDAPGDGFQDCEPPYVFEGDSTIAALGIEPEGMTHELTMPGHIRITRDTITHEEFAPPDTPVFIAEGQVLCIEWAGGDRGGMAMMLEERWEPPGMLDPVAGERPGPIALLALGAALALGAGVSWLAFRHRPPAR